MFTCAQNICLCLVPHTSERESRHSVAVTLSPISSELHLVHERVVYCLKFQRTYNTTTSTLQQVLATWAPSISLAINWLQLQPVKCNVSHNYVIKCKKCLIFTLSESIIPEAYSLQFFVKIYTLFWDICTNCFFLNTV